MTKMQAYSIPVHASRHMHAWLFTNTTVGVGNAGHGCQQPLEGSALFSAGVHSLNLSVVHLPLDSKP